eukprot:scaffold43012_cov49-Phaeocystis_antarctica.AAC.5
MCACSAPAMRPIPSWALPLHVACAAVAHPPFITSTSPLVAYPPFDSAASIGVQPAAEPRHVQRHNHAGHVLCAPAMRPVVPFPLTPRLRPAAALPSPCSRGHRSTSSFLTRQSASAFNQPLSLDTSSVTTMFGMFAVRTRVPCAQSGLPLQTACAAFAPRSSRLLARTLSYVM